MTSWSQTDKIDRIQRANAQKHIPPSQATNGKKNAHQEKTRKSIPCVYFSDNFCIFSKHHETKGVSTGIFVVLALPRVEKLVPTMFLIVGKNQQKKTLGMVNGVSLQLGGARYIVGKNVNKHMQAGGAWWDFC